MARINYRRKLPCRYRPRLYHRGTIEHHPDALLWAFTGDPCRGILLLHPKAKIGVEAHAPSHRRSRFRYCRPAREFWLAAAPPAATKIVKPRQSSPKRTHRSPEGKNCGAQANQARERTRSTTAEKTAVAIEKSSLAERNRDEQVAGLPVPTSADQPTRAADRKERGCRAPAADGQRALTAAYLFKRAADEAAHRSV